MKRSGTKDFALGQELSIEAENQKGDVMFCCSSMSVASAEGSRWEAAVAILMLRHCIEAVNAELSRDQKTRSTQRTKRPRDLLGNHQKKQLLKKTRWSGQGREMK